MPEHDTAAIDTIAEILSDDGDWSSDDLDAIAAVLNAVRARGSKPSTWVLVGEPLIWRAGRYVPSA